MLTEPKPLPSSAEYGQAEGRLAVLIDADNVSPTLMDGVLRQAAAWGRVLVRRAYGDFVSPKLKSWTTACHDHSIAPMHHPVHTAHKNSADIALVIDAMELLMAGHCSGFVLVSSDSDFAKLASKIREYGREVWGIGRAATSAAFVKACTQFVHLESLDQDGGQDLFQEPGQAASKAVLAHRAVPILLSAMTPDDHDVISLSVLGGRLRQAHPDFTPASYGCSKLSDLIARTGLFRVDRGKDQAVLIRSHMLRTQPTPAPQ